MTVEQPDTPVRWLPGTVIMQTQYWRGSPLNICPVIVVKDEPEVLVLYTRAGTMNLTGGIANRYQKPLSERTRIFSSKEPAVLRERRWKYHVLSLNYPQRRHAVWLVWQPDWEFFTWYVNFQPPFRRTVDGIMVGKGEPPGEYLLDIMVTQDLRWSWKDMDEFDAACSAGIINSQQRALVLDEARRMIEVIERKEAPFSEPWPLWRPDLMWPAPHLTLGKDGGHVLTFAVPNGCSGIEER